MVVQVRKRRYRLPAGESVLTRLTRVEKLLKAYQEGGQPSDRAVKKALAEYHALLHNLWLWGFRKQK